uniref:Uncharacterized protein n=1 Tax=Helianthus annuus TaxID=4232 RepID=A0A251SMC0_HELAN
MFREDFEHVNLLKFRWCVCIEDWLSICTLLLIIEKVYAYDVEFVINISELGGDDPLLQHATQYFI